MFSAFLLIAPILICILKLKHFLKDAMSDEMGRRDHFTGFRCVLKLHVNPLTPRQPRIPNEAAT
jgi:hypothetical protein